MMNHLNGTPRGSIAVPAHVACDPQALSRRAVRQTSGAGAPAPWRAPARLTRAIVGESPLNKAEAHRLAHKLRDPKFYTSRTDRAVNSLTVERGPKVVQHD